VETRTEPPRTVEGRGTPPPPPIVNERGDEIKPPSSPRKKPPLIAIIIGAVVLIAILIWGIRFLAYATTHETTDDARVDADTVTITSKISERVSQILTDTNEPVHKGQVLILLDNRDEHTKFAQAQAAVAAQEAQANAAQQNVDLTSEQQSAQKSQGTGGVRSAQAQVTNAQAMYQAQMQTADAARAAVAGAQAQLLVAQAQVPSAGAALARANADFERYSSLARTGDASQQQLDAQRATQAQALSQYRAALDQVTSAQTNVVQAQARETSAIAAATAAQAGIGANEGQLETAQGHLTESAAPSRVPAIAAQANAALAQVKSAKAQAQTASDQLNYTTIRSPIDGVVGAKNIEVGATVAPGQALLELVPQSKIYITANFKETQLTNMKVGQEVDVDVDAYKGTTFQGRVESIGPASQNTFSLIPAQNATGNFVKVTQRLPVRISIVNPPADKPLRVGMSVETSVKVK
jgi:membrane fusion protein (multidrug efflux system)